MKNGLVLDVEASNHAKDDARSGYVFQVGNCSCSATPENRCLAMAMESFYDRGAVSCLPKVASERNGANITRIITISIACACVFLKGHRSRIEIGFLFKEGQAANVKQQIIESSISF